MEPGHEDREYWDAREAARKGHLPQWSPVMKTGNTTSQGERTHDDRQPQWSPVMKTGNTGHHASTLTAR